EYLILLGLVAVVCIASVRVFGGNVSGVADKEGERVASLEGWSKGPIAPSGSLRPKSGSAAAGPAAAKPAGGSFEAVGDAMLALANPKMSADGKSVCVGGTCVNGMCFEAGTLVRTEGGSVPIERLARGDVVLSRAEGHNEVEPRAI